MDGAVASAQVCPPDGAGARNGSKEPRWRDPMPQTALCAPESSRSEPGELPTRSASTPRKGACPSYVLLAEEGRGENELVVRAHEGEQGRDGDGGARRGQHHATEGSEARAVRALPKRWLHLPITARSPRAPRRRHRHHRRSRVRRSSARRAEPRAPVHHVDPVSGRRHPSKSTPGRTAGSAGSPGPTTGSSSRPSTRRSKSRRSTSRAPRAPARPPPPAGCRAATATAAPRPAWAPSASGWPGIRVDDACGIHPPHAHAGGLADEQRTVRSHGNGIGAGQMRARRGPACTDRHKAEPGHPAIAGKAVANSRGSNRQAPYAGWRTGTVDRRGCPCIQIAFAHDDGIQNQLSKRFSPQPFRTDPEHRGTRR